MAKSRKTTAPTRLIPAPRLKTSPQSSLRPWRMAPVTRFPTIPGMVAIEFEMPSMCPEYLPWCARVGEGEG